jgi:hypothetical protein
MANVQVMCQMTRGVAMRSNQDWRFRMPDVSFAFSTRPYGRINAAAKEMSLAKAAKEAKDG